MKLTRVEISNYRSIKSASIDIDRYATVLMGRNDVGKSNILQAILAFGSSSNFSKDDRCRHADIPLVDPRIAFHFDSFTDDDLKSFTSLPIPISPKTKITVTREGNDPIKYSVVVDDKPILSSDGNLSNDMIQSETEISTQSPTPTPELWKKTIPSLSKILPSIVMFTRPEPLPSKVTIEELEGTLPKFETARRMLKLAGVQSYRQLTPDDFAEGSDFRMEISNKLTQLLQLHWLQDESLAIDINYQPPHLLFTFKEATTRSTYPEQHSEATTEYVSLLANLLDQIGNDDIPNSLILLFDEPGCRLHPGGQRDLRLLLRNLSIKHQMVYTSHSPSLIDRNYPGQIRLVTKTLTGTFVNNKPHAGKDPFFLLPYEPIRNAIGIGLGDSLIFDDQNVVLEGISDQILLGAFSQSLSSIEDSRYLDLNKTALIPAGSAQNIEAIAKMAKARQLSVAILFDSDEAGLKESSRLKGKQQSNTQDTTNVAGREILIIDDVFSEKKPRCIEDIFPSKLYYDAVNKFYSSIYPTWKTISSKTPFFKNADKPIAVMISNYFSEELKGDFGGFDKVRVAREMAALLTEAELLKADGQIRAEYDPAARLLGFIKTVLSGGEPEKVIEQEEPKPHSPVKSPE